MKSDPIISLHKSEVNYSRNCTGIRVKYTVRGTPPELPMPAINEKKISCPYCGEQISILVDDSLPEQHYVEDCQVCCRPMLLDVSVDTEGDVMVDARSENE